MYACKMMEHAYYLLSISSKDLAVLLVRHICTCDSLSCTFSYICFVMIVIFDVMKETAKMTPNLAWLPCKPFVCSSSHTLPKLYHYTTVYVYKRCILCRGFCSLSFADHQDEYSVSLSHCFFLKITILSSVNLQQNPQPFIR